MRGALLENLTPKPEKLDLNGSVFSLRYLSDKALTRKTKTVVLSAGPRHHLAAALSRVARRDKIRRIGEKPVRDVVAKKR